MKYDKFITLDVKIIQSKKNNKCAFLIDTVTGKIVTSKPINYIEVFGITLNEFYKIELGRFTNDKGYIDFNFVKVSAYTPITKQFVSKPVSNTVKESPQATTPIQSDKPAWLR